MSTRRFAPIDLWLVAACLLAALLLIGLSLARYWGYNAGMLDLGVMAQSIWSGTQGQPLLHTAPDFGARSRLAVHVELFYFALVPLYALVPRPETLLVVQALLFVAGAIPAYRMALRNTGSVLAARCLALIYLLYPVAQTAVLFDIHGDTFALPLLMFALDALDRRAWRAYGLWVAAALSCKFYVAVPVLVLAWVIWRVYKAPRVAAFTAVGALSYGLFAFLVVRRVFAGSAPELKNSGMGYLSFYFGQLDVLLASADQRVLSALVVMGPMLLLGWRGWRLLLPALPLVAAALLSTGPGGASDYRYHHYAVAVPFFVAAVLDGALRMQGRALGGLVPTPTTARRSWRGDLVMTTLIMAIANIAFVDTPLNPLFWLRIPGQGLDSSAYGITARDALKNRFLAEQVPPSEPLAASTFLAPHVSNRHTLYVTRYQDDPGGQRLPGILPRVNYVLADALFDWRTVIDGAVVGGPGYEQREIGIVLNDPAFGLVAARDGLLLFRRNPAPGEALPQQLTLETAPRLPPINVDLGPVRLLGATIEPLGERRFRASFEWELTGQPPRGTWFAVSRLGERNDARIVHLPSFALLPVGEWRPGQVVREQFELQVPIDLPAGSYPWTVAWYNGTHPEAFATDQRALPPGVVPATVQQLNVP